ncbi:SusF/SusE family outer membrane protein [Prevotella histicola]|jgi:conserved domain protein|uniref:Outer membrane protein SusF/SusE-like C-terminal domain-containing protein n=1 Tax=Prevotella histicola F0411 TaxID=857291 RepID=G6AJL9_9BACT|nr:SusF/SusE family outer membrane protein [Prevotella histicola]EHG15118.1 hypothetical protein HMPREF9138_02296 [Prevotella histicola F0411]MBF1393518.1 SusF/SusE family outer membrane protein [Prevotella histicola]MBF1397623.1 SusF/SusE family outer membrane protein [Prevotella histicola]MBF1402218.1 SusF/SusE family outer membrane protein [Prevotella histicola]MBF1408252.1 SusF/SusE family outer membrane protein [Prevotella histicola]
MKKLMKYGMFALLALLASTTFQSCNDDKDIVVITEELPLKLGHLYMVGDATPAGWNIDNPFEMTKDANDNFIFTYHGKLNVGELKFPIAKGDWGATFIYAPEANTEINANGVASSGFDVRKGGADNKWKITQAGYYNLTIDLRTRKISAAYEGEGPVEPIAAEWLSFIGDATPYGWDNNGLNTKLQAGTERFTKTSDNPLQFTYEGHLNVGEFKLVTNNSDLPAWSNLIQAPEPNCEVNHEGVAKNGMTVGGVDNKWKVTEAGTYKIVFDLTNHTIKVESFTADAAPTPAATPWDTETVYMIGSATPAGWVTDNGVEVTKTGDHLFSVEVQLSEGEMKFMLDKSGFSSDKPYFFAPEADTEINENGVANDALAYGTEASYGDKKWKVTKAGKYKLTLDLNNKKLKAEYLGA